ncbi:hypothetical protein AQUCO_05100066v1 [Aquilegia coerulea]|uniref:Uncharacterized protein n=1 Tax=Aquilegia coerulea TaxID=218851 RepID=A0A2G5CJ12_AQUCA|nr:hypothetical protein AQUCO_05100066v1 [Aquilegia coerulea]
MDFERNNHSNGNGSELFICFTSRPSFSSSSSMKISSKQPILSPNHSRDQPTLSFSSSLNRRHGSMKGSGGGGGQASPMFKKRGSGSGSGFENAEPTSPKVTCIGQVRVKTKKQGKKMMNLRKREDTQGEILLEKKGEEEGLSSSTHRNQKWVHLPLTICEALRGFGAEFNCFQPCGGNSSRSCSSRSRVEKRRTMSSCGAVFAKWLMALQEGEEEKRREIRVIVGEEEKREEKMEIDEEKKRRVEEKIGGYEEERFSICIPPRNALLLMRCRSDPLKMSALANRFWDSPIQDDDGEEEDGDSELEEEEDDDDEVVEEQEYLVEEENPLKEQCVSAGIDEEEQEISVEEENPLQVTEIDEELEISLKEEDPLMEEWGLAELFEEHVESVEEETPLKEQSDCAEVVEEQEEEEECSVEGQCGTDEIIVANLTDEEILLKEQCVSAEIIVVNLTDEEILLKEQCVSAEIVEERENLVEEEALLKEEEEELKEEATTIAESTFESVEVIETIEREEKESEAVVEEEKEIEEMALEKENEEEFENRNCSGLDTEHEEQTNNIEEEKRSKDRESAVLPDCLLMMLCEPKLSMEVSKETWVCSTDFTQRRSQKKVIQIDGGDNKIMNKGLENFNPAQQKNQQLSCISYPVQSMASMIEQKLMNAVAYEPFVLTRCKSEPLRTSAKLVPDACFWKNQQLEPRPGVGF